MSTQEFWWPVNIPLSEDVNWSTLVTKYEDGKEQRRKKWSQPKRGYSISLKGKTREVMSQVWDFYNARNGIYDTFYFTNPNENPITGEIVGVGNGSNVNYNLQNYPLPSGAIAISVGGVAKVETTNYTLSRATGAVTFVQTPASGDQILATYSFCRVVRFAENKLTRELFNYRLYNSDLTLIQVL